MGIRYGMAGYNYGVERIQRSAGRTAMAVSKSSRALRLNRMIARPPRLRGGFSEWRERRFALSSVCNLNAP